MLLWMHGLMDCTDYDAYVGCVKHFEVVCLPWSLFFDYVNDMCIISHKENFFKAWIGNVTHLRNTTSNRYIIKYAFIPCMVVLLHGSQAMRG